MSTIIRDAPEASSSWALGGLSWLHFLNDGAANFLPGVLPALLVSLGQPIGMAASIMTVLLLGQALQPAMGWLADRLGGRYLIIVGVLGTNLGMALIGWLSNIYALYVVLFLMGLSNSLFHPQALAAARSLAKRRHGSVMSLFLVGGELGRGLWPLLASLVILDAGRQNLWMLSAITLVSVPLVFHSLPIQAPRIRGATPIDWSKHWRAASMLVAFVASRSLVLLGLITYLPIQWHQQGGSLSTGAALITTLLVVGVVGNLGGGWVSDHIGRKNTLIISRFLIMFTLAIFLKSSGWLMWPLLGILGVAIFSTLPISVLIGQDIFPENRALGSGIALGLGNAVAALSLLLFGLLVQHVGIHGALVGVAFLSMLLAATLPVSRTQ
jgi:FSR family fosmidomycin resistance protein-like MFS transporter